uniref:Uncharacterized protein n=1 Tax=Mucochytrium quahogii TaxID=96639 RepID=A0A7S2W2X3_9STRA|mmetsp:Transcript_11188/g.24035  ORF Transcript_11188/g.24035 Transcript_11188/m.24035 type:complete len:733 (+) Transcript_11188:115-2313(+)
MKPSWVFAFCIKPLAETVCALKLRSGMQESLALKSHPWHCESYGDQSGTFYGFGFPWNKGCYNTAFGACCGDCNRPYCNHPKSGGVCAKCGNSACPDVAGEYFLNQPFVRSQGYNNNVCPKSLKEHIDSFQLDLSCSQELPKDQGVLNSSKVTNPDPTGGPGIYNPTYDAKYLGTRWKLNGVDVSEVFRYTFQKQTVPECTKGCMISGSFAAHIGEGTTVWDALSNMDFLAPEKRAAFMANEQECYDRCVSRRTELVKVLPKYNIHASNKETLQYLLDKVIPKKDALSAEIRNLKQKQYALLYPPCGACTKVAFPSTDQDADTGMTCSEKYGPGNPNSGTGFTIYDDYCQTGSHWGCTGQANCRRCVLRKAKTVPGQENLIVCPVCVCTAHSIDPTQCISSISDECSQQDYLLGCNCSIPRNEADPGVKSLKEKIDKLKPRLDCHVKNEKNLLDFHTGVVTELARVHKSLTATNASLYANGKCETRVSYDEFLCRTVEKALAFDSHIPWCWVVKFLLRQVGALITKTVEASFPELGVILQELRADPVCQDMKGPISIMSRRFGTRAGTSWTVSFIVQKVTGWICDALLSKTRNTPFYSVVQGLCLEAGLRIEITQVAVDFICGKWGQALMDLVDMLLCLVPHCAGALMICPNHVFKKPDSTPTHSFAQTQYSFDYLLGRGTVDVYRYRYDRINTDNHLGSLMEKMVEKTPRGELPTADKLNLFVFPSSNLKQ